MKNKSRPLLTKLIIIVIITAVIGWMFLAGGCCGQTRIKLCGSNFRVDTIMFYATFAVAVNILFLMRSAFEKSVFAEKYKINKLLSVQLLF